MADQHGVVAGRVQPAIHRIVQRNAGQRAPALQQQVLVEHEVALIRGGEGCPRTPPWNWPGVGPSARFGHNLHCAT